MMSTFRFTISPSLLGGLASLIPGEKSPLSPLNITNPPGLDPDQRAELVNAGLMDDTGLLEGARLLLVSLSEAPSFARLRLSSPGGYMDEAIHFTDEGSQTVGISNTPDGLAISSPGEADAILAQVSEFTGSFDRPSTPWLLELPTLEALCLAALLDLRRKAVLRAIIDHQQVVPPPGDTNAIFSAIQAMWGNPQWLTAAVQNTAVLGGLPSASQIQAALASMVARGLVWQQGSNFFPLPDAIAVIDRFLLIGTIITLDAGNSNLQGAFSLARQSWLQAGSTEMLHLIRNDDNIRLETVTPGAALEKIRFYLTSFDAVEAPQLKLVDLALVIQAGLGTGQIFMLGEETVLGRSDLANARIMDSRASRRHAVVRKLSQGYQLTDAGSTNGTFLNGQILTSASWLHEGDLITIGETQIKVIRAGETPQVVESDRTVFAGVSRPSEPISMPPAPSPDLSPESEPPPIPEPGFDVEIPSNPVVAEPVESELAPGEVLPEVQAALPSTPEPSREVAPAPEIPPMEIPPAEPIPPGPVVTPPPAPPETLILPEVPAQVEEGRCSRCGQPLQPDDWVCRFCGQPIPPPSPMPTLVPAICPNCGTATNPGARFCGACGYRLAE